MISEYSASTPLLQYSNTPKLIKNHNLIMIIHFLVMEPRIIKIEIQFKVINLKDSVNHGMRKRRLDYGSE